MKNTDANWETIYRKRPIPLRTNEMQATVTNQQN